jgi:hypothetical protein
MDTTIIRFVCAALAVLFGGVIIARRRKRTE